MTRQLVETTDGQRYHLLRRSADTSLVRCVDTEETKSVPTAELQKFKAKAHDFSRVDEADVICDKPHDIASL